MRSCLPGTDPISGRFPIFPHFGPEASVPGKQDRKYRLRLRSFVLKKLHVLAGSCLCNSRLKGALSGVGLGIEWRACPLIQSDYRQEKMIFELFSGALQENPVRAPGAITGQGPIQEPIFGELFSGALQENPVIAPGQLHEKMFTELFW